MKWLLLLGVEFTDWNHDSKELLKFQFPKEDFVMLLKTAQVELTRELESLMPLKWCVQLYSWWEGYMTSVLVRLSKS